MTEKLGLGHHGMDRTAQKGAMQRLLSVYYESSVVSQLIAVVLLAGLLRSVMLKPKRYKMFPVWATIEIALSCYTLSGNGLSRRI